MSGADPFQYAIWRVVPDLERGERINAGVVLFARTRDYLGARVALDPDLLAALAPGVDADRVARRLEGLARIAAGDADAGPIAALERHQRFHWLTAPSSTVIQPSDVHTGVCGDPEATLERLFTRLVRRAWPPAPAGGYLPATLDT